MNDADSRNKVIRLLNEPGGDYGVILNDPRSFESGLGVVHKPKLLFRILKITPMLCFRFYGKDATGWNIVYS